MTHTLSGGCHCGALHLLFETQTPPRELPMRICTCSFCIKQGARYTSDKDGRVTITAVENALHRYRFGTQTAEILSCRNCGGYLAAATVVDGALYAAINVNMLDDLEPFDRVPDITNFAYQTAEERVGRRQANWTPATLDVVAAAR